MFDVRAQRDADGTNAQAQGEVKCMRAFCTEYEMALVKNARMVL